MTSFVYRALTSEKRSLRIKFLNFCRLHTCRSSSEMIYSIVNYNVFRGNFLSYETLLLSREDIYDRIDNKMPGIF